MKKKINLKFYSLELIEKLSLNPIKGKIFEGKFQSNEESLNNDDGPFEIMILLDKLNWISIEGQLGRVEDAHCAVVCFTLSIHSGSNPDAVRVTLQWRACFLLATLLRTMLLYRIPYKLSLVHPKLKSEASFMEI